MVQGEHSDLCLLAREPFTLGGRNCAAHLGSGVWHTGIGNGAADLVGVGLLGHHAVVVDAHLEEVGQLLWKACSDGGDSGDGCGAVSITKSWLELLKPTWTDGSLHREE